MKFFTQSNNNKTILISVAIWEPKPSNFTSYLFHFHLFSSLTSDNENNLLEFFSSVFFCLNLKPYKNLILTDCVHNHFIYFLLLFFCILSDKTTHIFTVSAHSNLCLYFLIYNVLSFELEKVLLDVKVFFWESK